MLHRPNAAARCSAGCIGSCLAGFALYLLLCVSSLAQSAHVRQAQVRHVVDGDTLVLDNGETVRLAGINAPELGQKGQPDQPLAAEATRALRELVGAGTVVVEEAMEREDRHGRTLAYLTTTDGRSIQAQLLREGLASAVAVSPNVRHLQRYAETERRALAEKRGIWGLSYYRTLPATSKAAGRGGYAFVYGKVQRIEIGDRWYAFSLAKHFVVLVPRSDWAHYFEYPPCSLDRSQIAVRGWVSTRGKRSRLVIKHAFMLERCGSDPVVLCPERTARRALPETDDAALCG